MAIVPVRGKWKIYVKKVDGERRMIEIDQDSTVRKLYSTVRRDLKDSWGFKETIKLQNGSNTLVKNDSKMSAVGLYNGVSLTVVAESSPYSWDLFVKLPGKSTANTITLYESETCEVLYSRVMQLQGNNTRPLCIKDPVGDDIPDEATTKLVNLLYDGASLVAEYRQKWSLIILHQGRSQSLTMEVKPDCLVRELFQDVRKKVGAGEELRLTTGIKDLDGYMDRRLCDPDLGLKHGSSVCVVMRTRGGSDPRVQMLHNCPNKDVVGVSTPSLRACPYCGALVQHTDACKHMNCPACSKAFCFICLSKNDGRGWQCGSYNSKCNPAPRQTYIPG